MTSEANDDRSGSPPVADMLRQKARLLAETLPRYAIRAVIREVEATKPPLRERALALRAILIEYFNRLRPLKARRLFTTLFEPLLLDDPILLRASSSVPGVFQRADIGGLWFALVRQPLRAAAAEAQAALEELSQEALIDDVLVRPQALALRATLARETVAHLTELLGKRKALDEFLRIANREALRIARDLTPCLPRKAPIDTAFLVRVIGVLDQCAPLLAQLHTLRGGLREGRMRGRPDGIEVEQIAEILLDACRQFDALDGPPDRIARLRWLPAQLALHARHHLDAILRIVREEPGGTAPIDPHPLHENLMAGFEASCLTIADTLKATFTPEVNELGQPIALPRKVNDLLTEALRRFAAYHGALGPSGILSVRSLGGRVRPLLADVAQAVDACVLPIATERVRENLFARDAAEDDFEDMIRLLAFVHGWGTVMSDAGYARPEADRLAQCVLRDGEAAYLSATRLEAGDDPKKRMEHLVRINALLGAVGENIVRFVNPMSQGMQMIVRHHLRRSLASPAPVVFIIEGFMSAVRTELGRSRHWRSSELAELNEMYEAFSER